MSACQQGVQRALGAHAIAIEERGMGSLGAYEIIAAIVGGSYHHIVFGERVERALKNRRRQVRAVAVEGNHALPARRCEVREHRGQACG